MLVRDTEAGKWHRWGQFDRTNRTGAVAAKLPPLPLSSACAHRVALSLPGFGYSSRLRTLLACGATVVHVRGEDEEFFMPALVPGEHLLVLGGKDAVGEQLLPTLEALQRDSIRAARIAAAGQRFANEHLSFESVLRYVQTLLRSYAARFRGPVAPPTAEDVRVRSAADVRRLVHLCDCRGGRAKDSVRACLAAVPNPWRCSPWTRPLWPQGDGRCLAAVCCVGWDCGDADLSCPPGYRA